MYAGKKPTYMAEQVVSGLARKNKPKTIYFVIFFEILSHSHLLVDYEQGEILLKHLKVKTMLLKHWSKSANWEMSEHLHLFVWS